MYFSITDAKFHITLCSKLQPKYKTSSAKESSDPTILAFFVTEVLKIFYYVQFTKHT